MSYRDDLKAFLDGELPQERMAEIRQALETDASLRAELEDLSSVSAAFAAIPSPMPHGMEQTLLALQSAKRPNSIWRTGWLLATGMAAAAVLALVMILPQMAGRTEQSVGMVAMKSSETASTTSVAADTAAPSIAPAEEAPATTPAPMEEARTEAARKPAANYRRPTQKAKDASLPKDRARALSSAVPPPVASAPVPANADAEAQSRLQMQAKGSVNAPTEIVVESIEEAETALKKLLAENGGILVEPEAARSTKATDADPPKQKSLSVLVPEPQVDRFIEQFKLLPKALADAKREAAPATVRQGGLGGAGGGGLGGGQGVSPPAFAKDSSSMKTVRIVIKKKPAEPDPVPEAGN